MLSGILPELQTEILRRAQRRLAPDGFLLLGPKETPNGIGDSFVPVQFDKVTCYNPKPLPPGEEEESEDGEEVAPWEKATIPWVKLAMLATGFGAVDVEKATAAFSDDADMSQRLLFAGNQDTASADEPPHASLQEAFTAVPKEQLLAVALIDPLRKAISDTSVEMNQTASFCVVLRRLARCRISVSPVTSGRYNQSRRAAASFSASFSAMRHCDSALLSCSIESSMDGPGYHAPVPRWPTG